jgi:hypothetical protein
VATLRAVSCETICTYTAAQTGQLHVRNNLCCVMTVTTSWQGLHLQACLDLCTGAPANGCLSAHNATHDALVECTCVRRHTQAVPLHRWSALMPTKFCNMDLYLYLYLYLQVLGHHPPAASSAVFKKYSTVLNREASCW